MPIFELHCHSCYSRGEKLVVEGLPRPKHIIRYAARMGLKGIAITDHDTIKGWKEARDEAKRFGIIFIPGLEISTKSGHIIGLGLNQAIKPGSLEEVLDSIKSQGGISVAPHPFDIKDEGIGKKAVLADVVEVFNSFNLDRLSNWKALRFAKKMDKPKIVGSDAHFLESIGLAKNFIDAQTPEEVLKKIKKGDLHFSGNYVSASQLVWWSRQRFINSYGHVLAYIDRNYSKPRAWLAKKLLRIFIFSENGFWKQIARVGMCLSFIYSVIKNSVLI